MSVVSRADHRGRWSRVGLVAATAVFLGACGDTEPGVQPQTDITCDLNRDYLFTSLPPNAIPAVNNPPIVDADAVEVDYLEDDDRVLGVVLNGEARAYPHNVLWHHEIVNDEIGGTRVSVTFCPLTGSGLAFSPELNGRSLDLGVSGLLWANNLVIYDRTENEVYGPQLKVAGACEGFRGASLELMPVQEMSWARWKELHPDTKVISGELGFSRNYTFYPYESYREDSDIFFPQPLDTSRDFKERVLSVRDGDGGRGFPFTELAAVGAVAALNETIGGVPTAIFYEGRDGEAALAFDARVGAQTLTFQADLSGVWIDDQTSSTWDFNGVAVSGPLAGERLATRADAWTVFWFAWRHFQPDGDTFLAP